MSTKYQRGLLANRLTNLQAQASRLYLREIQALVNKHNVILFTGQMSDVWQFRKPNGPRIWHEWEDEKHPLFQSLKALDEWAEAFGIGPSNLERFEPTNK